ncbi:MAG: GNAT family N-acetyltransferase [Candidatus Methanofastidiosia archaeon]
MIIKNVDRYEIDKIKNIDRSEIVENIYYYQNGKLVKEKEFYDIRGWDKNELAKNLKKLKKLHDRGGSFIGAFDSERLVGIGALENRFIGENLDTLQLVFLHVGKPFRKKGIGTELMEKLCIIAREKGAKKLYISATPSENTVNFYLNRGCYLAKKVIKELYEEEPEDIHLELEL